MAKKVYQELALCFGAWKRAKECEDEDWKDRWAQRINEIVRQNLPSGGGFDIPIRFDFETSSEDRLILHGSFHEMEDGFYADWYDFAVVVTPSLAFGFNVTIRGRFGKKQDLKDFIGDVLCGCLSNEFYEYDLREQPAATGNGA
ncbi:hypothetical protein [Gelria sp. Kuro-4]|uniref:hypothetical protein n=1 Tax=Gelria sp. Kuro-4 TaxID=2796927 RepID=UPI001BEFFEE0|nr:hypothetical protein [Gelria sp. Kuro-4]BCV23271.1 hypothetical protein kuro4_00440 [Gelria sp. Kuro-4]